MKTLGEGPATAKAEQAGLPRSPRGLEKSYPTRGLVNRCGLEGCLSYPRGTTRSGLKGFAGTNEGEGVDMHVFDAARGLTLSSELLTLQHQFQKQGG